MEIPGQISPEIDRLDRFAPIVAEQPVNCRAQKPSSRTAAF
jgi:hypothetical protein